MIASAGMKICWIQSCLCVISLTILNCDYTAGNLNNTRDVQQTTPATATTTWNPWSFGDTAINSTAKGNETSSTGHQQDRNSTMTTANVGSDNIKDSDISFFRQNMSTVIHQLPIIQSWILNNSQLFNETNNFNSTIMLNKIEMLMTDLVGSVNQTGHPFVVRKDWIWNATQYPENLAADSLTTVSSWIEALSDFTRNDTTFDVVQILNSTEEKTTRNASDAWQSIAATTATPTNSTTNLWLYNWLFFNSSPSHINSSHQSEGSIGQSFSTAIRTLPENRTDYGSGTSILFNTSTSYPASTERMWKHGTGTDDSLGELTPLLAGNKSWTVLDNVNHHGDSSGPTANWFQPNSTTTPITPWTTTMSRPSITKKPKNLSTETPSKLSANSSSPWNSWPNGNHYNSIVNVNVDSSHTEALDRGLKRLEVTINKKLSDMEKVTRKLAFDLQSKIVQLEAILIRLQNHSLASGDIHEIKNHMELLLDKKTESLESRMKIVKCESKRDNDANRAVDLQVEPTTVRPQSTNKDTLSEWRAERGRLMDRWEAHFQRGRVDRNKSQRSLHRRRRS